MSLFNRLESKDFSSLVPLFIQESSMPSYRNVLAEVEALSTSTLSIPTSTNRFSIPSSDPAYVNYVVERLTETVEEFVATLHKERWFIKANNNAKGKYVIITRFLVSPEYLSVKNTFGLSVASQQKVKNFLEFKLAVTPYA